MNHRKSGPLTDTCCMERQGLCQRQKYHQGVSLCVILVELDHHFVVGLYLGLDMLYKL